MDPFGTDFGLGLGDGRQDAGIEPPGRRVRAEPVLERDEIDPTFPQFLEELARPPRGPSRPVQTPDHDASRPAGSQFREEPLHAGAVDRATADVSLNQAIDPS
jgi:hypothetical protein